MYIRPIGIHKHRKSILAALLGLSGLLIQAAEAADWSDTYIGYRYGTKFAEPYETNDIHKNIFNRVSVFRD
jgi:hypothetical protein